MYPLGNYMNKKNVFFAFLWLFLCLHCMCLEKSPTDFPFIQCWSRGPRLERKQSMCLSARWQGDTRSTQQYVVSLDRKLNADSSGVNSVVVYKHLWSLERIIVGNSHLKKNLNHKTPSNVSNIPHKMKLNPYPFDWGMGLMDWWPVGLSQANKRPQ